ncbi:MAG: hypothetical protein KJ000_16875 [Pirellulaceae bacterium]|nr:hypothetical protein [Pirellulaceae bacterium]
MKLLGLRANKDSFHPVTFRPEGLSSCGGPATFTSPLVESQITSDNGHRCHNRQIQACAAL